jgi:acyl-CoA synthetase (AMP-forming)/AMP-acid ligase II/thioesterase domain-containing protein/acyl carrier protein
VEKAGNETLHEMIRRHGDRDSAAPAILTPRRPFLSYGRLAAQIESTRATLNGHRVGRGDRIASVVTTRPEAVVAYVCAAATATVIPLDPKLTAIEMAAALRRSAAKAVIASEDAREVHDIAHEIGASVMTLTPTPALGTGSFELHGGVPGPADTPGPAVPDDVASIVMSSGTTAESKMIPMTHAVVMNRATHFNRYFKLTAADVIINVSPPYYVSPLSNQLAPSLVAGGRVVIPNKFDPDEFFDALVDFGVTFMSSQPTYYNAILNRASFHSGAIAASRLRWVVTGGSAWPGETRERFEAAFGLKLLERYSSSEAGLISCTPLPPSQPKPGTVGRPSGCDVEIRDERGRRLRPGEEGQIVVRGPSVVSGYDTHDAERTAAAFTDGWFHTGDLGFLDEDGYLTFTGRSSDVINRGGQKVSPLEVERALLLHSDVAECIVFPAAHKTLGQLVAAAVVPRSTAGLDEPGLQRFLRGRLAEFKIPTRIVAWSDIPRGARGKPSRNKASERFALLHPSEREAVAPVADVRGTRLSRSLAALWCEVLELKSIGEGDNFFMSGGDSLRAVRLLTSVTEVYGITIAFDVLYQEGATVAGMAKLIEASRLLKADPGDRRESSESTQVVSTAGPAPDLDEILRRLDLHVRSWPWRRVGGRVPIFVLNASGHLPAQFWFLNDRDQARSLASAIGPEQPLYVMPTLNNLTRSKQDREIYIDALASIYADQILELSENGPYLIGGSCQGGRFAEPIAHLLMGRHRHVAQLSLVDYEPRRPYPARVALFFGADSAGLNPLLKAAEPESTWKRQHREVVWDIIPGDHSQALYAPYVATFVEKLKKRISEAVRLPQPVTAGTVPAPTARQRFDIRGGVMWRDMRCHNGTKAITGSDGSLRFSTPGEPWSYAVEVPIDPVHADDAAASQLEVRASCTAGVLAVAVLSLDDQTILYEYFIRRECADAAFLMSLPPTRAPFSVLFRNGYLSGSAHAVVERITLCRWEPSREAPVSAAPP